MEQIGAWKTWYLTCEQCIKVFGGESDTADSNISRNILNTLAWLSKSKKAMSN